MRPGFDYQPRGAYPCWHGERHGAAARFSGRGPHGRDAERGAVLRALGEDGLEVAWGKQVHGATLREARPGPCGECDALTTRDRNLALAIATADCVPILLAAPGAIAAVHAGWRGLVAGALVPAVAALGDPARVHAWIGPAIGACCYVVGDDVAQRVIAASQPEVAIVGADGRTRLDLAAAARHQLEAGGVTSIDLLVSCTRCDQRLWSYRREGQGAGRNLSFIWRT